MSDSARLPFPTDPMTADMAKAMADWCEHTIKEQTKNPTLYGLLTKEILNAHNTHMLWFKFEYIRIYVRLLNPTVTIMPIYL